MSGEVAVTLLNKVGENRSISFAVDSLGIGPAKGYSVKDLWTKESFDLSTDNHINREVVAYGVVVLIIKGKALPYNVFQYDK